MILTLQIAAGVLLGTLLYHPVSRIILHGYQRAYSYYLKRKMNINGMSDEEIFEAARDLLENFDYTTMAPDEPRVRYRICSGCRKFKKNFGEGKKAQCLDCEFGDENADL